MGGSYAEIRAEERREGTLRTLRKLIANAGMTLEQAMRILDMPEEERKIYRKELEA